MFVRSSKVRSSSGIVHEYVRIVSSVRDPVSGKPKQKTVANLGRRETLQAVLPMLNRFLSGDITGVELKGMDGPVSPIDSSVWGHLLLTRSLFDKLGLWEILDLCKEPPPARDFDEDEQKHAMPSDWRERVMVLVANRLSEPCSEHALAYWLEKAYVCDRHGSRYVPKWLQSGRVNVAFSQLQRWYRTLDALLYHKNTIEIGLYLRLRDLFALKPQLVFYDITSTYFEGRGPAKAKHGHSRDGKPRKVQLVIGVVMVAGWPITHHVWEGNRKDSTTVAEVIADLRKRFGFERVVFVGDRGMVNQSNLDLINNLDKKGDAKGYHYLLGMVRRRNPEVEELIERIDEDAWEECPVGINAREKETAPRTRVQEVRCDREGVRVFVVDSEERQVYEESMRKKSMARAKEALDKVQERVAQGRLKKPEKIGAAMTRALQKNHGYRYYDWHLTESGKVKVFEHPVNLPREKKHEGKYLIQCDESEISAVEAVERYKELNEVERGFRSLKDPVGLRMRPVYHRCQERAEAHIFVAALGFLLERYLEKQLKAKKAGLSVGEARQALATVSHVSFKIEEEVRTGVTAGSKRAQQVLKALEITEMDPPKPEHGIPQEIH